jgi:hypothetical protein
VLHDDGLLPACLDSVDRLRGALTGRKHANRYSIRSIRVNICQSMTGSLLHVPHFVPHKMWDVDAS